MAKQDRKGKKIRKLRPAACVSLPLHNSEAIRQAKGAFSDAVDHHQRGDFFQAACLYRRAINLYPSYIEAYLNLSAALAFSGKLSEALHVCDLAASIAPAHASIYNNRGNVLRDLGRHEEALADFDRAILLNPNYLDAYLNRGIILHDLKRYEDALLSCNHALTLAPSNPTGHLSRGIVLSALGRNAEALSSFDLAICLDPRNGKAHANRGAVLLDLRRYDDALASCNKAVSLAPNAIAHMNLGNVLEKLGRYEEALVEYDRAIHKNPVLADAFSNKANVLFLMREFDNAMSAYNHATTLSPDHAEAHWNKSLLMLLLGNYEEGWHMYEWRWKSKDCKSAYRNYPQPLWLGNPGQLRGKTILIHAEQGQGDTIQMMRYVPIIAAQAAKIVLDVPDSLASMICDIPNAIVLKQGSVIPDFDIHCPFMSLPLAFGTTLETIPDDVPYLRAPESKVEKWSVILGHRKHPRIGLVWSGATGHRNDHNRSIALQRLSPFFDLDVEYHSLQVEYRNGDQEMLASTGRIVDHSNDIADYSDTAALIEHMDLVITVDTSVAHLVGALGKPVWIMLPHVPDWRWLLDREDSPWYPTARLFRQPSHGDWDSVIKSVISHISEI